MSAAEMYWGHVASVVVAFLMLGAALRWPGAARVVFAVLYLWASQENLRVAFTSPADYQGYADLTWSRSYREFITGFFAEHTTSIVTSIALGQLAIGFLLLSRGARVKLGLAGAIVFLLAIVPLGVGSGFPSTLIMAAGCAWLLRERFTDVASRSLLGAGVVATLVYVSNDFVTSARFPHYGMLDQAISELSAVGAPTKALWDTISVFYTIALLLFALVALRRSGGNRALRHASRLLLLVALSGPLWLFVPMHERGAVPDWRDTGHLVLAAVTVLLMLAYVAFGAFAFGGRFRVYSLATLLVMLASGAATFAYVDRVAANDTTPWMGLFERVSVYSQLAWVAVLSLVLLRQHAGSMRVTVRPS